MHVHGLSPIIQFSLGILITAKGFQQPCQIHGTAGHCKPALALREHARVADDPVLEHFRMGSQMIGIKEAVPAKGYPAEHPVIKRPFHHIAISPVR